MLKKKQINIQIYIYVFLFFVQCFTISNLMVYVFLSSYASRILHNCILFFNASFLSEVFTYFYLEIFIEV